MAHLTLTKSKTSRISRPQTKSPIKKQPTFDLKNRRILDSPAKDTTEERSPPATPKLEVIQNHLPADSELIISDVLAGMNYLAGVQFPPFPEKGLSRDRIADLYNARKAMPSIIMLSQLHSVFSTHTLIERELSTLISSGIIRKLILRGSSADGRGGEVTGAGGEVGLITASTYHSLIESHGPIFGEYPTWLANAGRTAVSVSHSSLIAQEVATEEEIKKLIEAGFLTMDYSIREAGYTISVPGSGNFIRNLRGGRRELLRSLKRQKYREMLEKNLMAKKLRESILSYGFHLHELVGSGRVEVFMTPAGRGLKITSKGLAEVK